MVDNLKMKNKINTTYIYVDESGTLPDPTDTVVIIAAVATTKPEKLEYTTKNTRNSPYKKIPAEIKFYRSGEKTKKRFFKNLTQQQIDIFILEVKKQGKSIPDSPLNYALLCWQLLIECQNFYPSTTLDIIFDKHFHKTSDQDKFQNILINLLGENLKIQQLDSQQNSIINTADMVAGSFLWSKTGKDTQFYDSIKDKVVIEKSLQWQKLATKYWRQKYKKTRPNRRKRPSK